MSAPGPTTLIDAVDDADEPVATTERRAALEGGFNFRVVHVFVFNARDDLLIQRLAPTRERHPLRLGSSVAGYLYAGETPGAGARRRLYEELGLRSPVRLFGVIPMQDESSIKFVSLFTTRADAAPRVDQQHIAGVEFVPWQDLSARLRESPADFTDTFRLLASFYQSTTDLASTLPIARDG